MFDVLNAVIHQGMMVVTGIVSHQTPSVVSTLRPFCVKAGSSAPYLLLFQFVKSAGCVVKFVVLQVILCCYKVLEMFAFGLLMPLIETNIVYCILKFCELGESVESD